SPSVLSLLRGDHEACCHQRQRIRELLSEKGPPWIRAARSGSTWDPADRGQAPPRPDQPVPAQADLPPAMQPHEHRDDGCPEIRHLMPSDIGLVALLDRLWWRVREAATPDRSPGPHWGTDQTGLRPPRSTTRRKFSTARWTCLSGSLTSSATS